MNDQHKLIEQWRDCPFDRPPFLFPGDRVLGDPSEDRCHLFSSLEDYVQSTAFGMIGDSRFHLGLLPIPYVGNLESGSVFLLMLNPGFNPGDYFAEYNAPDYRPALIRNLRQDNGGDQYPFLFLDPKFAWHPGFNYWHSKFWGIVQCLKNAKGISYQEALSTLAKELVSLELIPYHSSSFRISSKLFGQLESPTLIQSYVRDVLRPRAEAGEITIIVTRSAKSWGLTASDNIVVYDAGAARGAHLTPLSSGGRAILQRLGVDADRCQNA